MPEPNHISEVLAELFARRGYARAQGNRQLRQVWAELAGPELAAETDVVGLNRGVLQVVVRNSTMLSELVGFHQSRLLQAFQRQRPELQVKGFKFRLQGAARRDRE
uniref:DUF721 domain-containing protein n=1 Tax=Schlesneria paludicola TaxID=360056 RepID=A0A7C2PF44_9PLAN